MAKTLNDRLFDAIKEDDKKEVSKCLKEGAVVYATDSKGRTPLHLAYKSVAIAELLIEHRADPNATDNEGLTPLHNACFYNGIEISKLLIEKGANINVADNKGLTPLHKACSRGRISVAKLLIENGADVNAADNKGLMPLYKACLYQCTEIAKLLIPPILLKDPKIKKPEFIKASQDLSGYWDAEVKKINLKINFLKRELSKTLVEDIVNKIPEVKKDSLFSLSYHQFFKLLNPEKINETSKEADESMLNTAPSLGPD